MEEQHTLSNEVTSHPVEEGFNATDHSRPDPDVVNLRCFVSNTPLSQEQQTRTVQEGAVQFTTTAQQGTQIGAVDGRGAETFKKLKKLRDDGTLIKVVTTLKTYGVSSTEGMMIQSITVPRTTKNYDGLEFSVTLKQVRIVKNRQTTDVRPKNIETAKKKNQGAKTAKPPQSENSKWFDNSEEMSKSSNSSVSGTGDFFLSGGSGSSANQSTP